MCVLFIGSQRIGTVHCLVYKKPEGWYFVCLIYRNPEVLCVSYL